MTIFIKQHSSLLGTWLDERFVTRALKAKTHVVSGTITVGVKAGSKILHRRFAVSTHLNREPQEAQKDGAEEHA